jgi:dihydrofolate synthase/folylpolyglutamate synthase
MPYLPILARHYHNSERKPMTPQEALSFIHNVSWRGSKPGLSRTREMLSRLGDPQAKLRFVHVAGTNGKGSVCAMLASVLTAAGYRTGLYISPYIMRFYERMRVDGVEIEPEELASITEWLQPHALAMADAPTEFELVTSLAMEYFKRHACDIVVLETGLGGRLDSTNVIPPPVCAVLTNIGLDHTELLGDTVEKIAVEKAAIIKPGSSAVLYGQKPSVEAVVKERCRETGVPLRIADPGRLQTLSDSLDGQVFRYRDGEEFFLPLLGEHQLRNAAVVLETVGALREAGFSITGKAVREGLRGTRWPARFELVAREPYFIVDGGHNPQCAASVARSLERYFPGMRRVLLLGMLQDKDYQSFCDILAPCADGFVTITPDSPRALPAADLAAYLRRFGKPVTVCGSIAEGVEEARRQAKGGMACSVGSLYSAGAIRAQFGLA